MGIDDGAVAIHWNEHQGQPQDIMRWVRWVLWAVVASLTVASSLHLFGHVKGRSELYDPVDAGIAEAVIAVVLAGGTFVMARGARLAQTVGLATTGFAIAGFVVGLTITSQAAHAPDIAYHLTILPILIVVLGVLARARATGTTRHSRQTS